MVIENQRIILENNETEPRTRQQALVPYECFSDDDSEIYELLDDVNSNQVSLLEEEQDGTKTDDENEINCARKRKRKPDKNDWVRNKNKRLRMQGKAYLGFTKNKGEKIKQNMPRKERNFKKTCGSKQCKNCKVRYCREFTEDCRKEIFNKFWSMDWNQRKVFVASHVFKTPTYRKTKEHSRRAGTYAYYLNDGHENLQVCRTMFINTLDIGYKTIQYWVDNSAFGMTKDAAKVSTKDFVRKRHTESYKFLGEFFDSLPKLPSHYCRRDTLKLYLEYSFQTMNQLYGVYTDNFCREKSLVPLGRNVFVKTFKENNLALYTPKKDQCNLCFSFKYGNITEEEHKVHIERKENARQSKVDDKILAEKGEIILLTIDLQAVKLCPYLPANKIYFKTKLCCHNFTVYDLRSRDVMCYWFSENENNQLKASTFTSCIIDYLQENCLTPLKTPIVIYSDGCGYQNRNNVLANALLNFSIQHNIVVFQKYLEPGHTQMECESVHSGIERCLRHREIHLPSDYVSVTTEARKTPKPYGVKTLDYTFFKDYSSSKYLRYSSIRPGKKSFDPEDYIELPVRPKIMPPILSYPPLFNSPPKLKTEKWQHLQELKSVLPKDTHAFYDSILHS
ncbi:hypothetical protein RI129_007750 [Pyrocoelia pectoralis]|uniref:Uncharacterized protein n=1 Tax=Pyrocoelia pectoralis TaxID=417401 RepID=A0AAN7V8P2_9COLE